MLKKIYLGLLLIGSQINTMMNAAHLDKNDINNIVNNLIHICIQKDIESAKALLDNDEVKRKVWYAFIDPSRPIHSIIGNLKHAQFLINIGVLDINMKECGQSLIRRACNQNQAVVVKFLINNKADVNEIESDYSWISNGSSLLHTQCTPGCNGEGLSIIKILINSGLNPNIQDNEGNTTLMLAVKYNNKHAINFLLSLPNINIKLKNKDGFDAEALAYDFEIINIFENYHK